MEVVYLSETLVSAYKYTRRHNLEEHWHVFTRSLQI
jgi:hypothetical protein